MGDTPLADVGAVRATGGGWALGGAGRESDDDVMDDLFSRPQKSLPGKQCRTSSADVHGTREREVSRGAQREGSREVPTLTPSRAAAGTTHGAAAVSPSDKYSNTPSPRGRGPSPDSRDRPGGAAERRAEEEACSQQPARRRVRVMRRVRRDGSLSPTRRVKGPDGMLEA